MRHSLPAQPDVHRIVYSPTSMMTCHCRILAHIQNNGMKDGGNVVLKWAIEWCDASNGVFVSKVKALFCFLVIMAVFVMPDQAIVLLSDFEVWVAFLFHLNSANTPCL